MELDEIKTKISGILRKIEHFDKLKFIYIYGSSIYGKKTARSDIDICLYYDIKDKRKLHKLLLRIIGVIPEKYDIQMFQMLPLYVKKEIFKGKLIYAKDKGFVHDIAYKTIRDYEDFEPRYKHILFGRIGMEAEI